MNKVKDYKIFVIYYSIISFFYILYFYLIGGTDKNSLSFINFVRNDTFLYHDYAIHLKNYLFKGGESLFTSKFNNRILLYFNVWLQGFVYLIYESLWFYIFFITLMIKFIHSLLLKIYRNFFNENIQSYSIIILLPLVFFPSFIHTSLIMGKDLFIILIILIYINFLSSKKKSINIFNYSFLFFITLQCLLMRPNLLYATFILCLLLLILVKLNPFLKNKNESTIFIKKLIILLIIFFLSILFINNLNIIGISSDLFKTIQKTNDLRMIDNSKIFPIFLNKILQFFHYIRESFNFHQTAYDSNSSIYNSDYNNTLEIFAIIFTNSFLSIFSPVFFKIDESLNILFFFAFLESFVYFILSILIFFPYSKKNIEYKILIYLFFGLFCSITLFTFPNIGTFVRYKIIFFPILLLFAIINIQKNFSLLKDNYLDKKLIINKKYFLNFTLIILMMISFIFRDFIIIKNLDFNQTNRFIIYTSLMTVYLNIFNTIIIDLGKNDNKKLVNYFSFISILVLFGLTFVLNKNYNYINESFIISLIAISAVLNSNILANNLDKNKKTFIFISNIIVNFSILYLFYYFDDNLFNVLIYMLISSLVLNVIFYDKKDFLISKLNLNINFQGKYILNQLLVILIFLFLIDLTLKVFIDNQFSSYSIKLIYSIIFGAILSIKLTLIPNYSSFDYKKYTSNYFTYFYIISLCFFSVILISFLKIINFINFKDPKTFYVTAFFVQVLFYNLISQKIIFYISDKFYIFIFGNIITLLLLIFYSQFNYNLSKYEFFIVISFIYSIYPVMMAIFTSNEIKFYFRKIIMIILGINSIILSSFFFI